ncbi:MAG: hypothetical protein FWF53_11175 [Candidatus Azobacteroides sp.]|nr:hypothetical protein [Candidatus Azobacteroides sp.]
MKMQENKSESEQIKDVVYLCLRHWYYFVISLAICIILAFVYLKIKTPVMQVTTQVSLRHDESLMGGSSMARSQSILSAFGLGGGSQNIEDESLKMGSQGYLKKVVRKYALNFNYKQSEFLGLIKKELYDQSPLILSVDETISDTIPSILFTLNVKKDQTSIKLKYDKKVIGKYEVSAFPSVLETPLGAFTISKSAYYDWYKKPIKINVLCTNFDYMTQIYKETILIDFEKKSSDLIHLSMNTENVGMAKKILNEVIATYNTEWEADKNLITDKTLAFIDDRLQLVDEELLKADQAIQNFKDKYTLTDIEADVKYYFTLSGELQPALLEAETELKMVDLVVDFVKDDKNKYALFPLGPNIATPAMAEIIGKYNEVLAKRNEMYKSSSQSALVKELNDRVESQRETLLKSVDNVKKGLLITVENLKKKESEINNKIGKIPTIEKNYLKLKREQELQQTVYIFLLEMREEAGVKGVSLLPKLNVIDEPYVVNKPVEPNRMKVLITALFFGGIVFPAAAIYGFPLINNYIRKRKEK